MDVFAQYGIAGVTFGVLFIVLKWMMALHDKVMKDSKEEREAWQKLILSLSDKINEHTSQAKNFHETVSEAHRFQREEHMKMTDVLATTANNLERLCKS